MNHKIKDELSYLWDDFKDLKKQVKILERRLLTIGDYFTEDLENMVIPLLPSSQQTTREVILSIKNTLNLLEKSKGKVVPLEEVKSNLPIISEVIFEEAIDKMLKAGDIFRPKKGFVQRIP